jgi:putative glutamine amidotransferase
MQAISRRGGYPLLLDVTRPERLNDALKCVHAVVIAGNSLDINPEDYGAQAVHSHTRNENEERHIRSEIERNRDDYEYALIDKVLAQKIPFLGICSGVQRLNVANHGHDGGTLSQHIEGHNQLALEQPVSVHEGVENVYVKRASRLAAAIGCISHCRGFEENSIHHQHVETVRRGFVAVAHNWEGVIEAIEPDLNGKYADHPFVIGVQWHPEYGASTQSNNLMDSFVEAARACAKTKPVALCEIKKHDTASHALREEIRSGLRPAYDDMGCARGAAL